MVFNSIRTKIIGGYMLFVLLILSFLGLNYLLVNSTVKKTASVYKSSEWIQQEMETENTFWRQVISMTDYFLTGDEEHITEFHNYQAVVLKQMATLESSSQGESERQVLTELRTRYELFLTKFDKASGLYRVGKKEEAKRMDLNEIDPIEEEIEETFEQLVDLKRSDINITMDQISKNRRFSRLVPTIASMIDSTQSIHTENEALQHSLEAEECFLKQVVALTDLFAFDGKEHIDEFHEFGEEFQRELQLGESFAESDEEKLQLSLIRARHLDFTNTFDEVVKVYESGDRVRALQAEIEKVDPTEVQLEQALKRFYPLKQQNMKQSLDNVLLIDDTSLSITRSLAVYLSLTLLIGLLVGAIVAVRITGPAKELAEATQRIASGDFSTRSDVKSGDEIGQLSRSFNRMAENLQRTTVSKDYVDGMIKSMGDSLVVASTDGLIVTVNPATCRMLGYMEAELIGQPLKMLIAGEEGPSTQFDAHRNVETAYLTKDGRSVPVEVSTRLVYEKGNAVAVQSVARDVTEHKRGEAERRAIAEIVHGVLTTSNLDELFTLAHNAISKLLSAENCFVALYDKTSDLLHIPFCKDVFDPIAVPHKLGKGLTAFVLRSGRPMFLTPDLIQELVSKGEIELVGTLPAAWLGVPLRTSTEIIGVLVVQHYKDKHAYSHQDLDLLVTVADQLGLAIERKQIEIKLRANEVQLNEAQAIARLGSWEWDVLTDKVRWSDELFGIFGLQPQESGATFETFLSYVHPDDRKIAESAIEQAYQDRVFPHYEYRIIRPDETVRTVQAFGKVIADNSGRIVKMVGTAQDITERKRAEKEREVISEVIQSVNLTSNLDELLQQVHQSLKKVLYAENCCVTLFNKQTGLLEAPFFVDQLEPNPFPMALSKNCTAKVFKSGKPLLMNEAIFGELLEKGEVELIGRPAPSCLAVPLMTPTETIGVIVVQHYEKENIYSQRDVEFLSAVAAQLALAIERKRVEEALIESNRRFRDLFYDAPVGYHELDTEGRITCVNTTELSMLGYSSEDMIGHHVWEFIEEAEIARLTFAEKIIGQTPLHNVERSFRRKDGTFMAVQLDDQMLRDPSGRVIGIRATMQNIVERKRTEGALRDSEERFRELFENASDMVCTMDLEGNLTSINNSGERLTGYTRSEALTMNLAQIVNTEMFGLTQKMIQNKLKQEVTTTYELDIIRKDGGNATLEISSRLLHLQGKETGIQAIGRDITQRKQVEAELKRARDGALESVRLKSEFLANMSHEIRTPMNGVIGMTGLLLDTQLTDEQRDFAETIRSSGDGLLTIINDILDFSKIEAGMLNFETLDFDINNAIESTLELLAERAHDKGLELASLICQDVPAGLRGDPGRLRQVLTNLIGNAIKFTECGEVVVHALKETETDDDVVIRFTVNDTGIGISEKAQRNLFQAFVQADGSTTRKYGGTGLGLAISKQLVELMGGQIGVTSVEGKGSKFWFTATFIKQAPKIASPQLDSQSLSALHALIVDDNATNRKILSHQLGGWNMTREEAESGTRALELLRLGAERGAPYDLAILDLMMPGMNGFELARAIKSDPRIANVRLVLLTSFGQRGDGAIAHEAGIAAYIAKPVRQAQLFQCLTSVMSKLPVVTEPLIVDKGPAIVTKHTLAETKTTSNKLILLAEDNIVNQKVAVRQLKNLGYRADAVANGKEALEALGRIPYDLVLMDCQMPEMDGYEATAEIRRREGNIKHTLIVAMTAHALDGDRAKCIAAGMDDYISKPVKPNELGELLERWLVPATISVSNIGDLDQRPPVLLPFALS